MPYRDRISTLRSLMDRESISAVIVPSDDPHMSEYPPDRFKTRHFLTGFTGSAGTAVFLKDAWGLWTDGRYYIQAEKQISPSGGTLFKSGEPSCPSIADYLVAALPAGSVVSINGNVCSRSYAQKLEKELAKGGLQLRFDLSLAEEVWTDRPALTVAPMWSAAAGTSCDVEEKLQKVREKMLPDATALLTGRLDSTAWLFNIRAEDIPDVPVPIAWSLITREKATLFTDLSRIPSQLQADLSAVGVELAEYDAISSALAHLPPTVLQLEPAEINMTLWNLAASNPAVSILEGANPIPLLKAVKDPLEIENTKAAYLEDCVALAEFYAELERRLSAGEVIDEYKATEILESCRRSRPTYLMPSFTPIAAFRENAAMMHYAPRSGESRVLSGSGFFLLDSGGHYRYGTTDITRTYPLGSISKEEQADYTTVVKGFIHLHSAVFKDGMPGAELDILCRVHLWQRLLDYRCGTGHGVGFMLNIHEGPQGFGGGARSTPLHSGMYLTIEPGIYREDLWGIRCENAVYIRPYGQSEYGDFLCFEAFTVLPIDPAPLLTEQLDQSEIKWLNTYNAHVREALIPHLSPAAAEWVRQHIAPIEE